MRSSHAPGRGGDDVQRGPEGLHDLSIYSASSRDKIGCVPDVAAVLMAVDMPQTYGRSDIHADGDGKVHAGGDAVL